MDLYASWSIPKEELMLDAIWAKFEEFSKPQTNEVRAHFDLLTGFQQGKEMLMNGIMWFRHKSIWQSIHQKLPNSTQRYLLVFHEK